MMPLLKPINNYEQLTFSQARKLSKPAKVDISISRITSQSLNYEANLDTIANTLNLIHASIIHYSFSTSRFQKFLHIFTGRYFKIHLLRRSLPSLINVVNREAMTLFNVKDSELQANEIALAAAVHLQYPASTPFLHTYHKIKVYQNPLSQKSATPAKSAVPMPMPMPVPVVPAKSTVPVPVVAVLAKPTAQALPFFTGKAAIKWQVLEDAHQLFLRDYPLNSGWDQTARMINDYIEGKKHTLTDTGDVSLPRFYHATQAASWPLIAKSKQIIQTKAAKGYGAYVSTGDESSGRYGSKTFALTGGAVHFHPGSYFKANASFVDKNQLWVRVEHEIDINPKTVAHFVSEDAAKCQEDGLEFLTTFNFDVPVITREASKRISQLFNQVQPDYYLPKIWQLMPGGADISTLKNIHPNSR